MAETRKQPRRSVLVAARLITAIIGLAGAEGVLWLGGYPVWWQHPHASADYSEYAPDPDVGWSNREGRFDMVDPHHGNPFRYTNWSQGRRATADREPPADAAGAPKVLFFGDSYVEGFGLSNEQTFAWMVQQNHPELAVSNYGTAGYGTCQSYLAIAKRVHGPCSVLYLFNGFHEGRNAGEPEFVRVVKQPPAGWFFPFAELEGGTLRLRASRGEMVWPLSRWLRTAALAEEYYQRLASRSRVRNKRSVTEALLVKMNETVLAAGGRFTVILFDMTPDQRRDYRRFALSRGIHFIDCDHPEMKDQRLRLPDGHPNQELNRLLARWIEPLPAGTGEANEHAGRL